MREIRFRAFHTKEKIFWYFDLVTVRTSKLIDRDWFHLEPAQQFTGLKDKNGKEIYEGDIVAFLDGSYISTENGMDTDEFMSTGRIEWCGERKGWDVTNREDVDTDECFDEYMEVIGNIYQNPELLNSQGK